MILEVDANIVSNIRNSVIIPELQNLSSIAYRQTRGGTPMDSTLNFMLSPYDGKVPSIDSHGISKFGILGNLKSLIMLLKAPFPKNLHTAPLFRPPNSQGIGAGFGTGGGTSYREGDFIVASEPNKNLYDHGIKYILVAGSYADIDPKLLGGKTGTQILQQFLGQNGKYIFVAAGETYNDLPKFVNNLPKSDFVTNILNKLGIKSNEIEIKHFDNMNPPVIGILNKRNNSVGRGRMVYVNKTQPDLNKLEQELQQLFREIT